MEKKLRILQVHNAYQIPGGEDVVVANEKKLLEMNGNEVFSYSRNNDELKTMNAFQKFLIPFTAVYSFKTYREVKKLIRENKIDIVHVHNTLMVVSPSVFYAAFHCHVPVVQTLHNFRMLCPAGSYFRGDRICEECSEKGLQCSLKYGCYRGSKAQTFVSAAILKIHRMLGTYRKVNFICLTEFNREKLSRLNEGGKQIVDMKKVYIKPNFTFQEGISGEVQKAGDYFLVVGRVEALKGIDVVVKAFEKIPDQKLIVAGDGPMMAEMKAYIKDHNMSNVKFAGYLDKAKVQEKYRGAKAVIMASQCYEAFAMTIAEAYSNAVPVIAGNVGNLANMVEEGVTGIKFIYDSPDDLAAKILKYNTMDIAKMKQNAKTFYEKRLKPEDNYRILEEIYHKIM